MSTCTLKRCQGKRGCICPKGQLAVGVYSKCESPNKSELPAIQATVNNANKKSFLTSSKAKSQTSSKPSSVILKSKETKIEIPSQPPDEIKLPPLQPEQLSIGPSDADINEKQVAPVTGKGSVTVRFNHYKKKFEILNGELSPEAVDAEYALSFAFPGSRLHLSKYGPSDFSYEELGLTAAPFQQETTSGNFVGLENDEVYWVHVEEDASTKLEYESRQAVRAAENAKLRAAQEEAEASGLTVKVSKSESCSCIEGNPCLDKYCCKDWDNRYAVAKKNGWKGFQ